ncbi:MAG: chemotaxis protein CheW [Desulfamplus sp.]|nr:chemotaxis protein CheW [Desulfamplus sp.]
MAGIPEKLKILLVEDDRTMRQIEIRTLKKIGYTDVVQASDGEEAIRMLEKTRGIDVVISDWNMPKKGGLDLLLWIRSSDRFKKLPFIMATGQADKIHEHKAVDAGVTGFLVKPFADEELKFALGGAFGAEDDESKTEKPVPRLAPSGKVIIRIAHIQITDHLVLGVLKHLMDKGDLVSSHFELEPVCMPGWNPVAKELEQGTVDGACILAPLAMDLYSVGTPIKLVLLSHKNGSMFVSTAYGENRVPLRAMQKDKKSLFQELFKNSSFLIPHKMSVHHMLSHLFLSRTGLVPSMLKGDMYNVEFEVVPPVNMPEFLEKNQKNSGFMVAEPIGSQTVESGMAQCMFLSGRLWENHPCCAVVMQNEFIESYPDAMFELVDLLVKSGKFISENPDAAANIAISFLDPDKKLGLTKPVLKKVLAEPGGITTGDLYPVIADLETMQQYMVENMGIGSTVSLNEFVDSRFADSACESGLSGRMPSVLYSSEEEVLEIAGLSCANAGSRQKLGNNFKETRTEIAEEGKYLTFFLASEEYGISIRNVREIIGMLAITHVPMTPDHVKGVINLRGKVIPVMDLRLKFGMESAEYTDRTCILVVEIPDGRNQKNLQMGVIVDSVSEVLNIRKEEIEDNPRFGSSLDTSAILGMARIGDRVRILLDIDKAVSAQSNQ